MNIYNLTLNSINMDLFDSAKHGDVTTLIRLLDGGADINQKDNMTALHVASMNDRLNIVKVLIQRGADVNCRTGSGSTPLMLASRYGYLDIVKELLSNGANINLLNNNSQTALHLAAYCEQLSCVQCLLLNDANVFIKDNMGKIPKDMATDIRIRNLLEPWDEPIKEPCED